MISNKKAAGVYDQTASQKYLQSNYTSYQQKNTRYFDRKLLPSPAKYYIQQFGKLCLKSEWIKVSCCFHDDHDPSLSLNMIHGGFICHACGSRGGDVLAFQMQHYHQSFKQAVTALDAWRVE